MSDNKITEKEVTEEMISYLINRYNISCDKARYIIENDLFIKKKINDNITIGSQVGIDAYVEAVDVFIEVIMREIWTYKDMDSFYEKFKEFANKYAIDIPISKTDLLLYLIKNETTLWCNFINLFTELKVKGDFENILYELRKYFLEEFYIKQGIHVEKKNVQGQVICKKHSPEYVETVYYRNKVLEEKQKESFMVNIKYEKLRLRNYDKNIFDKYNDLDNIEIQLYQIKNNKEEVLHEFIRFIA